MAEAEGAALYEAMWRDEGYALAYAFDSAMRDRFPAIRAVWGDLPAPGRLLDYGSGNGALSFWMFANGFGRDILGVDISATGTAFAQRRLAREGLRFHTLEPGETLDPLGRFDAVVCSHVLEHLPEPAAALGLLAPLAEWLVIEVPLERCLVQDAITRLGGRARTENPVGHLHFWDKAGFRALVEGSGLEIVREHHYASAPFSPYTRAPKRAFERAALALLGTRAYGRLMATHYAVLARRRTP